MLLLFFCILVLEFKLIILIQKEILVASTVRYFCCNKMTWVGTFRKKGF